MREDALVTAVREAAQLPDDADDYTAAVIRRMATDVLQNEFAPALVAARAGIGLKRRPITLQASKSVYALPPRAMSAGLECLDITDGTSYWPLTEITPNQAWQYETSSTDRPRFYCVLATGIKLYPTPNQAYTLRTQFYSRPSIIVAKQLDDTYGIIDAINYSTRQITLAANYTLIFDQIDAGPISVQRPIDIISLDDTSFAAYETVGTTYDLSLFHAQWSGSSVTITVAAGYDVSEVKVGDAVRAANQSEWPTMLPHEHHILLAHATAARICMERGMRATAEDLRARVSAGMPALKDGVQPRVKSSSQTIVPRAHMLRRGMF